jgi:hypothetical protein
VVDLSVTKAWQSFALNRSYRYPDFDGGANGVSVKWPFGQTVFGQMTFLIKRRLVKKIR